MLFSRQMWAEFAAHWGATRADVLRGEFAVGFLPLFVPLLLGGCAALAIAAGTAALRRGSVRDAVVGWAFRGWLWWLLPGVWQGLRIAAEVARAETLESIVLQSLPFWLAVAAAGWFSGLLRLIVFPRGSTSDSPTLIAGPAASSKSGLLVVLGMCVLFSVVFVRMNWQMYFALNVPHGDSAMYEEQLWNLSHGKGFRSYLDDGRLFLGEHVQVVHVLLLPLHLLWPSQLMLELCETLALASGAIPVYWMARRHSGSARIGALIAGAYLLYMPMHYLDISIDGKTFRPTSFGVPALLFALDQLERKRLKTMFGLLLLGISAKEDYAVVVSCLGVWMALRPGDADVETATDTRRRRWWGFAFAVFGAVYLLLVIKFVIPAFRGGEPHYARYFGELGNTPGDVARSFFTQTDVVLAKLFSLRSASYAILLLLPLGFLPLRSPGRLAVALPWFGMLCLLELTADPSGRGQSLLPWHHFHAAIVPVIVWAAAAGIEVEGRRSRVEGRTLAAFAFGCALFTQTLFGFDPASPAYYDPGSPAYGEARYTAGKRARAVQVVLDLIPKDARVFSTDFVHTRFTHYRRSYDYSNYRRKSDEELTHPVPGETYYIVIDTQSKYSEMKRPEDVPEFHSPDWELVHHTAEKYFIVLRRRS